MIKTVDGLGLCLDFSFPPLSNFFGGTNVPREICTEHWWEEEKATIFADRLGAEFKGASQMIAYRSDEIQ